MRIKTVLTAGFGLMMMGAAPAFAEAKIYPYHGENFCPAGYQPVTISGVVCCGVPNQSISYQQAKMTAAPRHKVRRVVRRARRADCPVGSKGCTFD